MAQIDERILRFREERVRKIASGDTPAPLDPTAKMVLHLVPEPAFNGTSYDLSQLKRDLSNVRPMYPSAWAEMNWSYREGGGEFLTHGQFRGSDNSYSYLLIQGNGIVEVVNAYLLNPGGGQRFIPRVAYEKELISSLRRFLSVQEAIGVSPPIVVLLSLIGVSGYTMSPDKLGSTGALVKDENLLLPPGIVEDIEDCEPADVFRPAFDAIWQAAGYSHSLNYGESGDWVGQ